MTGRVRGGHADIHAPPRGTGPRRDISREPARELARTHPMITERRQIIFSNDALKDALLLFRTAYPDRVPHGRIHRAWVVDGPDLAVHAEIEPSGARRFLGVRFGKSEMAAAVILYCRRHKIPLPRVADKFLEAESGCLSLVITRRFDPPPAAEA